MYLRKKYTNILCNCKLFNSFMEANDYYNNTQNIFRI